jgi:Activator of Hsp90 ATPase homolog 1-like protein
VTDDAIVHEVVYTHPPGRVWRALTDSAALADWLMPNDFLPRVGHRFTFTLEPVGDGTRLRLEHTGFAAGGELGLTIRDILGQGWGSKLLRETLPALLGRIAAAESGGERR